jgi:serine/threonine protein kinase
MTLTAAHIDSLSSKGNCGISQLTEVAEDSLYTQLVYAREHGDQMTPEQKLRIGYHVAAGVADMHGIGNRPSVAHNDISSEQILLVNGVYKLSDFHLSSFMTQDRNGTNCKEEGKRMHQEVTVQNACFVHHRC